LRHQNSDKFRFKFFVILCFCQKLLLARESLILLVSHILKMAAMLKPSAEYNRRITIIEGLHAGRSATEIFQFFGYSINRLWRCGKIYDFRRVQRGCRGRITRKNVPRGSQSLKELKRWFRMTQGNHYAFWM